MVTKSKNKMKKKTAIVTGSTGQDGSYLCDFLLKKNYRVIAADRRSARGNNWRHEYLQIQNKVKYEDFDLTDINSILRLFKIYKIDEFYNLAAQSFVGSSFKVPLVTCDVTGMGVLRILDMIKNYQPKTKFYQASSSEMFGKTSTKLQDENTTLYPRSPYGVAKVFGHLMTKNYRESYNLFACSGILFNHESPLRGEEFVTKKIVENLVKIKLNKLNFFELGNIYSKRDWGYAKDYVEAMWKMLQQKKPNDYVICTSKEYSIKSFVNLVCKKLKINTKWTGKGLNEKLIDLDKGKILIKISKKYYRPAEVDYLRGSYKKAYKNLKWKPKTNLNNLISKMINFELSKNSNFIN